MRPGQVRRLMGRECSSGGHQPRRVRSHWPGVTGRSAELAVRDALATAAGLLVQPRQQPGDDGQKPLLRKRSGQGVGSPSGPPTPC